MEEEDNKGYSERKLILVSKTREKIEDKVNQKLLVANQAQRRAVNKVHEAEYVARLEALREAKEVNNRRKWDRKNWRVLFEKLKAELKSYCKPTQKVVVGVACCMRSSAFRELKIPYGSKETIGHFPCVRKYASTKPSNGSLYLCTHVRVYDHLKKTKKAELPHHATSNPKIAVHTINPAHFPSLPMLSQIRP